MPAMAGQAGGSRERSQSGDLRALKALVIGLGVLVVLGTSVVIGVIIYRIYAQVAARPAHPRPAQTPAAAPGVGKTAAVGQFHRTIAGGHGGTIAGVAAAGGRIAIWVRNDAGGKVEVIDPATGRTVGEVTLSRSAGGS